MNNDDDAAPETPSQSARLLMCVGPRCDADGAGRALHAAVKTALETAFAAELATGRLRLETRDCLRLCTREPVLRLEPCGDAYSGASVSEILRLVGEELSPTQ